ncbi:MAG: M20/M25/M40 family metallo-hydrolase [Bacteroidota bacterium]
MRIPLICLLIVVSAFIGRAQNDVNQIQKDLAYLASDLLEGRQAGTIGEELAAAYIQERMQEMGLSPKGSDGSWLQPFDFYFSANPHAPQEDKEKLEATNVVGWIDKGADKTIIIGGHFDHLGYGAYGSLAPGDSAIHNGADDNASGIAGLLAVAERLAEKENISSNILFIAFSGEELGLLGSKHFADNPTVSLDEVNYMLNLDMVGRLNDKKEMSLIGTGTASKWEETLLNVNNDRLKLTFTKSGVGGSDHTSFYLKDIPVLHFFTGAHNDYHKPSDDSHLINYEGISLIADWITDLVVELDGEELVFQETKNEQRSSPKFKVTLGVMPNYTYSGDGMKIDAVLSDRPAERAGLQDGDIVTKLGGMEVTDIYTYMEALAAHKKGDTVEVKVKRGDKIVSSEVTF